MNIIKREQRNFDPLREFFNDDRIFGLTMFPQLDRQLPSLRGNWIPAIDVSEDNDTVTVKADLPGLKQEEISVTMEDTVLTIKGERKSESEKKEKNYYRIERSYGAFERSLDLGTAVDGSKIKASCKNGVLEVILPKLEQAQPKQIKIDVS